MSTPLTRLLGIVSSRWETIFFTGVVAGAGFELFKIHFKFRGVSYYSVFKKRQLQKELDEFERTLKELDQLIAEQHNGIRKPGTSDGQLN